MCVVGGGQNDINVFMLKYKTTYFQDLANRNIYSHTDNSPTFVKLETIPTFLNFFCGG